MLGGRANSFMLSRGSIVKREFVRSIEFLSVSCVSAASNLLYVAVFTHLSTLPFWLVSLTSTEFSMVVNFILNDRITFRNLESNRAWFARLARFQLAALGGNLLTAILSTALHDGLFLSPIYAQGIAIVLTFFVNFFVHRFWTFQSRPVPERAAGALPEAVNHVGNEPGAIVPTPGTGVSVVVPVRNENATMRPLLTRLHQAMTSAGLLYEVLIVDDYSEDGTAKVAAGAIEEYGLPGKVLAKLGGVGKSFSLEQGFAQAQYPILAMIDGDLELPPEALPAMVAELAHYDVVVGRRLSYGKSNFLRAQYSRVFNRLVLRFFLGITCEVQTGIKVFWKQVYESVDLLPGPWGFDIEFVAQAVARGLRIGEYEVLFQKRRLGSTKVNPASVAVELLASAIRIKFDMLQDAKAKATLKLPPASRSSTGATILSANSALPVVFDWLFPLALLFLLLRLMMGPSFFSSQRYFGLSGDTTQYMWFIGWVWHALAQGHSPMVSPAFNYPYPINIMDYTSVPALGLLFGWLYGIAGMVFVYNLIVVVNYVLIAVFGKLMLRTLGIGRLLSSVGALLFCLVPYLTAQELQHLNLAFVAPLFIVGYLLATIIRSERPPSWWIGILTGLALTLAFYTYVETFVTLGLCLALLLGCAFLCSFQSTYRFSLRLVHGPFLLAVGAPLLLIIPGVLNFIQGQGSQPLNNMYGSFVYSNDLLSPVVPTSVYLIHTSATTALTSHFSGNLIEWDGYLSVPLIMCFIVYAARGWHKTSTRILTYVSICISVLSLGPILHVGGAQIPVPLPWGLMLPFPFIHDVLPARLSLYVGCLAIIVVIWGVDDSLKQAPLQLWPLRARPWQVATLAALGLVVLLWLPVLPTFSTPLPLSADILRGDQVVTRYIGQEPTLVLYDQVDSFNIAMGVLAASDNFDLVTSNVYGYSMLATPSYKLNQELIADTTGARVDLTLRQYLPQLGVGKVMFVSTDDRPISSNRVTEISEVLGAPNYNRDGLVVVWTVPQNMGSSTPVTDPLALRQHVMCSRVQS
jgi:putative flippase GtrA/glycosyltransferase involved in cell wall biosynthesis